MANRGRFQAQGDKLEESENWQKQVPLYYCEGVKLLTTLKNKISPRERKKRDKAFRECEKFIERASKNNGICVQDMGKPLIRSFPKSFKERVDVEVHSGRAFVIKPEEQ